MGEEGKILQEIISQINVDPEEIDDSIKKHSNITSEFSQKLGARTILSGSYKRGVAVSPLDDVDLFVWFPISFANVSDFSELKNKSIPSEIITKLKDKIDEVHINYDDIREQNHSVGLFYNKLGFHVDVIPAFAKTDPTDDEDFNHLFWIPEAKSEKWRENHPKRNEMRMKIANERANGELHGIVRLLKFWMKQGNSDTFKSFHLELLGCYLAKTKPEIFKYGIFQSFLSVVKEIEILMINKTDISKKIDFEKKFSII